MSQSTRDLRVRHLIAEEAARIMAEEGIRDFLLAKRKAASHLGAEGTRNMPRNQEIESALQAYQALFQSDRQAQRLQALRETAIQAMRLLERFEPRLVGPVLHGTAGVNGVVELHLFADTPEDVGFVLDDAGIPFDLHDIRVRTTHHGHQTFPGYRFVAGDTVVELAVFPTDGLRNAPLSPVDGRPTQRASLTRVERLLHHPEEPPLPGL